MECWNTEYRIYKSQITNKSQISISNDLNRFGFSFFKIIKEFGISGVSIHPELIQIETEDNDAHLIESLEHTAFRGTIKEVFYQGDFSELTVVLKENDKLLTIHHNRGVGNEVRLDESIDVIVSWNYSSNNVLAG